jgi:hypothetical protein
MDACRQPDINYGFHDFVPLTRKSHCSSSGVLICVKSWKDSLPPNQHVLGLCARSLKSLGRSVIA